MNNYKELKEITWECNMELPEYGLVVYTFGNASAIDRNKAVIAIKPSGIPYKELRREDIVIVDLEDNVVEGKMTPSSDTKTHIVLYNNFLEISGVVHTHSTYATAWAQAVKPIPALGTTHADYLPTEIPCTGIMPDEMIKGDYEKETGNLILEVFKKLSYEKVQMVLVAGHAPFTWAETPEKAVYNSVMLEKLAKMAMFTLQINPDVPSLKRTLIDKHYQRKHGKSAYYGQK